MRKQWIEPEMSEMFVNNGGSPGPVENYNFDSIS